MAMITQEAFVVQFDSLRSLSPSERREVSAIITTIVGAHFASTHSDKRGDYRNALSYCRQTTPYGLFGDQGEAARVRTRALTSGDPDAPVVLTLALGQGEQDIARFYTIAAAVQYLDENPDIDPVSLDAGSYGIDAPFGVASDTEADRLLYDKGYRLHATGGGSWSFTDPKGYLWDGGGKREAVVMIALAQAAAAEEAAP